LGVNTDREIYLKAHVPNAIVKNVYGMFGFKPHALIMKTKIEFWYLISKAHL
jgi:hypothetical protein